MYKQVIVVRQDIDMSPGKLAAQVAHAAVSAYIEAEKKKPDWARFWILEGQKKVVVMVKNKEALMEIYNMAKQTFPTSIIIDAGKTELEPGTHTCVGIGPAPEVEVDRITGRLPLLR